MKMLYIKQVRDPHMWYARYVGYCVPYLGKFAEAYRSREPERYTNIVHFADAELVEVEEAETGTEKGKTVSSNEQSEVAVTATESVLREVAAERARQDGKWGGPEADDRWDALDWHEMIADYNGWARRMAAMNSFDKARNRYVQIAALAVAAVEALDRKARGHTIVRS